MSKEWREVFPDNKMTVRDVLKSIPIVFDEQRTEEDDFYTKPKQLFTVFTVSSQERLVSTNRSEKSNAWVSAAEVKLFNAADTLRKWLRDQMGLRESFGYITCTPIHRLKTIFTGKTYCRLDTPERYSVVDVGLTLIDSSTGKSTIVLKRESDILTLRGRSFRGHCYKIYGVEDAPVCPSWLDIPVLHIVTPEKDVIQVNGVDDRGQHIVTISLKGYWTEKEETE